MMIFQHSKIRLLCIFVSLSFFGLKAHTNACFAASSLIVKAKGTPAGGVYAHFKVIADGLEVGNSFTTSTYQDYHFSVDQAEPVQEIRVVFDNNLRLDGKDRDLFVQSIELDGHVFNAPAPNVTYMRSDGQIITYGGVMYWNGSLIFEMPSTNSTLSCSGSYNLITQEQVDNFSCSSVEGTLTISGEDITNLDGLSSLTQVGYLKILDNPLLNNIDGLSSLTSTEYGISIINNPLLVSLDGLAQVPEMLDLTIKDNPSLMNIDGLASVVFGSNVRIINNDALTNLDGLAALKKVNYSTIGGGYLYVQDNDALENIDGLSQLTFVAVEFIVTDNNSLQTLPSFPDFYYADYINISRNPALHFIGEFESRPEVIYGFIISENVSLKDCCFLYSLTDNSLIYDLRIFNNGAACSVEEIRANGPCNSLIVNAKGTSAGGTFAHFKVLVNGVETGDSFTTSSYQAYNIPFVTSETVEEVRVVFDNDAKIGTADRNLYVSGIELNGEYYSAPGENVTYVKANGQQASYFGAMYWAGDLIFDLTPDGARIAGNSLNDSRRDSTGLASEAIDALVYPNPSNGQFTLELSNYDGPVDISLYDLTGKKLTSQTASIDNATYGQIDIYYPKKGIYLLKIASKEGSISRKVIVD